jgi:hypothetical protein
LIGKGSRGQAAADSENSLFYTGILLFELGDQLLGLFLGFVLCVNVSIVFN